ncbi:site-specific integrase [uncultured Desulfovibrio sp.]|uniref:tyrosine-type recombinase/integrase n=1 Tax=uncultured Desulfovibrio sp. TaxID=167968 RepID=UPI0026350EEE|nr:site-specific integrase [uncultured Desulfovibrio sp.]
MVAKSVNGSQDGRKGSARKATRFPGVQARESSVRRYNGRPDVCYTIDYRDESGKRIRRDIGWASEGITAAYAHQERMRLLTEARAARRGGAGESAIPPPRTFPSLTLNAAWEKYLEDWLKAHGKRYDSDQWMYDSHLRPTLGDMPLENIDAYTLDRFMSALSDKGLSAQTVRHMVGLVRRIMRRMTAWRLYNGPLPFDAVELPRINNARQRFLTPEEARMLLEELRRRSHTVWLMALISLHCGLRFSEIAGLRRMDVQLERGTLHVAESKNGRARHAQLTTAVSEALREALPRNAEDLLFPARHGGRMTQVSDTFARAVDALGLNDSGEDILSDGRKVRRKIKDRRQKIVFHSLRHTYASWLALAGEGQAMIAEMLGHSSLEMSRRYTHLMSEARQATAERISRIFSET